MAKRERTPKIKPQGVSEGKKAGKPKAAKPASAKVGVTHIDIPAPEIHEIKVDILGVSPLIVNKFSHKAQESIEAKQQGRAATKKAARDPEADWEHSMYWLGKNKPGFPAIGFKLAMIAACKHVANIAMIDAKGMFFVMGDLIAIKGTLKKRTDYRRIKSGMDIVYRYQIWPWTCELLIQYDAHEITAAQVINLLAQAGYKIGVGEWRPTGKESRSTGNFGRFQVKQAAGRKVKKAG